MELPESQNARDARIERLWKNLDAQNKGKLDLNGLKKGLTRIDHRELARGSPRKLLSLTTTTALKNASDLLEDVIKAMDKNGDQVIQYEGMSSSGKREGLHVFFTLVQVTDKEYAEFRRFVEKTEKELLTLFHSIDRNQDGKLNKDELKTAFKTAGLAVPNSKLDKFFSEVDQNNDGYISFEEWRDFLLFLPTQKSPGLKAVMSYYSSGVQLNAEGDTSISEETLEGLGMKSQSRFSSLSVLFGAIFKIADTSPKVNQSLSIDAAPLQLVPDSEMSADAAATKIPESLVDLLLPTTSNSKSETTKTAEDRKKNVSGEIKPGEKILLTDILPDPGYFAAGAVAGVISRTSTAPLDRLKVYLIANIGPAKKSLDAVKQGDAVGVAKTVGRPLIDATKELWKAGGMRSLFAGNGLNVVKVMPESAIKFGSYEFAKRVMAHMEGHNDPQNINGYSKFFAGGMGGMVSQLFVYPLDTLKFRMQCETVSGGLHGNALITATAKKMIQQGPVKSGYRGLTMGLIGMFPYSAIDLGTFEYLKGRLAERNARILGCHEEDALPGSFATGCIGAFSGAFGASIVYPINLLRTRLQAQGTVLHPPTYDGIVDVARKTVQNEGFKGLFKGITPNLLKVVPAVSITYVVYENAKRAMHLK
ncbi:related to peroxisomal Ca-dependent solute carrier protein [Rhynchosporium graminicola]|uniref:Mitochondrial thiamine pyrophosphate carrier 1 n=1 Tax=Rhynchosporium graminicola TaxID=2792576 RepID=A0A1E1KWM5_9HELO|nr:related to peroxisomal Ca-dependent solute carrier protein [Rhynchosporium commune]